MDQLHYAGGVYYTSTGVARGLVAYAAALAQAHRADVVEIPVLDDRGGASLLAVLVGPASQIATSTVTVDLPDVDDREALAQLARLQERLQSTAAPLVEEGSANDPRVPHPDWLEEL